MSERKRGRSRSPGSRRRSDERPRNGDGSRRYSGGREDPRETRLRTLKQIISQSADLRNWRASEPVEERALALCRVLTERGYLDGGQDTQEVAALMVQVAGAFSLQSSVYAVATGLCVVEGRSTKLGRSNRDADRDDDPPNDAMAADEADDSHDAGRNFGRVVVDGCCNALTKALSTGGFLRAKLLLRFLGELVNCGLVQAQEYGDLLVTLCSGYVSTSYQQVKQPCRDMVANMVLSGVLRAGPALSKAWTGGFSDLMDEIRTFMSAREAPFRHKGLRAIFVSKEDEDEEQGESGDAAKEDRHGVGKAEPMEDSLTILWDVVSALHDSGWPEDDLPQSILRLWKMPIIEEKLTNLSSLSLPEEVVAADTIPVELTNMGACELISCSGMTDDGTTSPADRPDWSYALLIMGERDLFDEDDGAGPASCSSKLLPAKERFVLMEYCKDILACFQPMCRLDGTKVGKWSMLVDQLFSMSEVAPESCQLAYLITGTLFLMMLQVPPAEHLAISCHRTLLELCRAVPKEVPAAVCYCTGRLFDELERLDTTVASRFGAWFADHLKNTEYKWPFWKHWCHVVELQPDNAQRVFVSNVLAELVKLSYADRIKKTLPEALWVLLPLDPTPICSYLDQTDAVSKSLQNIAVNLSGRVNAREDPAELRAWLDEDHVLQDAQAQVGKDANNNGREGEREKDESKDAPGAAKESPGTAADPAEPPEQVDLAAETAVDPAWRSNMLIQILLRAGQASPTHTFVYLDRYREYLRTLSRDEMAGEANQIAMLDGTAQLWQNSSQWFCLVCRYLLEIGVLSPATVIHYFFRDDNNNAIALSPFLWEVMSRAISLCIDRVNLTLNTMEDLEEEEKDLAPRAPIATSSIDDDKLDKGGDAAADAQRDVDPVERQRTMLSEQIRDQIYDVQDSLQQAQALCTATCSGFVQALANAIHQYAADGMDDFTTDPWWVSMTSYFKASLWLFAAAPKVPKRCLALRDEEDTTGRQHILDVHVLEVLASDAGCKDSIEGIIDDLKSMAA